MKKRRSKIYLRALTALMIPSIFLFGAVLVFSQKSEFSGREMRRLASPPPLTVNSILDGSFASGFNSYVSDHFPARERFVAAHALTELTLGKREVNRVILTKNDALCQRQSKKSPDRLAANVSAITEFLNREKKRGAKVCVGVIPSPTDVFSGELSMLFAQKSQDKTRVAFDSPNLKVCNFQHLFSGRGSQVYYKTDHHWNSRGAYEAYVEICRAINVTPFSEESFEFETVSEDFLGSAFARFGLKVKPDRIELPRFSGDTDYIRTSDGKTHVGFYDLAKLAGYDKYSTFLGGNAPIVRITLADRAQSELRPTMLVFRDSYASSLAPYLARHFNLVLCDPRYYNKFACDIAKESQAKYVIVLLSADELAINSRLSEFFDLP